MPKMKSYESFAKWAADQKPEHKRIISAVRKFVKKTSPSLSESVKWSNGVYLGKEWPVLFLYADKDHLQLGFFSGSELPDPKRLLQGSRSAKYVRHIKVYKPGDLKDPAIARLIKQAVKYEGS